ncbi:hypothetical protein [Sphingobacterium sp. Ag1]|uniref:hypothetical protein n=1 Tax=Sphingobacterium sp. Ag1 TaxID=1643451 RepID=UPI0012E07B92|nr:hypothetical protein [Sphingobacterium sp. Ag1]
MSDQITASTSSLLDNAVRLSEKVERGAMENLLRGGTDKVIHLANVRQLSNIVKQLNHQYDGQSQKGTRETDHNGYPDW